MIESAKLCLKSIKINIHITRLAQMIDILYVKKLFVGTMERPYFHYRLIEKTKGKSIIHDADCYEIWWNICSKH